MKKMLVLGACIACLYGYAQDAKWEITSLKSLKKGMGRLNLAFPENVVWSIDLYTSNNKYITNRSYNDSRNASDKSGFYDLPAGIYNLKLNTVLVQNVPIEEGKITRIKAGLLEIEEDRWELRTDPEKKFLTSGNTKKKMMLPIGTYQIGKVNTYRVVQITDLISSSDPTATLDPGVQLSPYYEISEGPESLGGNGKIALPFYPSSTVAVDLETGVEIEVGWSNEVVVYSMRVKNQTNMNWLAEGDSAIIISPGIYRVYVNEVLVPGKVSVVKGKVTTIKAGFLRITKGEKDRAYRFFFPNNSYGPRAITKTFIMVLPVLREGDRYRLEKYKQMNPASSYDYNEIHTYFPEIKDRRLTINGKKEGVVFKPGNLY